MAYGCHFFNSSFPSPYFSNFFLMWFLILIIIFFFCMFFQMICQFGVSEGNFRHLLLLSYFTLDLLHLCIMEYVIITNIMEKEYLLESFFYNIIIDL